MTATAQAAPVRHTMPSPLGRILLAASTHHLVGVWFEQDQRHLPAFAQWQTDDAHPVLERAKLQLSEYFKGQRRQFDLPVRLDSGTTFQQKVWQQLLAIEPGQTTTYADIAAALGQPSAVRAVGGAVGRNPVSIIVPCHRVIGRDGSLTGYAGGLDRKVALLRLEGFLH